MSAGKLYYFEFYGRGESCRMVLNHKKVKFEDCRLKQEQWDNEMKPKYPGKGLPMWIEKDGMPMNESKALLRYLGTVHGYYPKDAKLAWACDKMVDNWEPMVDSVGGPLAFGTAGPDFLETVYLKKYQEMCDLAKHCLTKIGGKFLCGDKMCIADFAFASKYFNMVENPNFPMGEAYTKPGKEIFEKEPLLCKYIECLRAELKDHLANRPPCPF